MMIKPGISELSRCVDSRYTLVTMAAKRARMIGENSEEAKTPESLKPVSKAVREIAEGRVSYVRHQSIKNEDMSWQTELVEAEEPVKPEKEASEPDAAEKSEEE